MYPAYIAFLALFGFTEEPVSNGSSGLERPDEAE